ncbi:MAG: hypothetical protein AB7X49_20790 [Geminicoccaceae bacterium]
MCDNGTRADVYREQVAWSRGALLVFFSPVLLVLGLVLLPPGGGRVGFLVVGVIAGFFLLVATAVGVLTITIDDQQLTVGFPVYRRRVPLAEIVACRPIRYRWWTYGGYGIRRGRGGLMLNVGGDGGRAVELTRRGGGVLRFSARDPATVCAAIQARRPDSASV